MKILHLASEFPPARIFGLGRYVHDLARAQVRQGHEVHVVTNSLGGRDQDGDFHGIRLHRIRFPSPPKPPDGATQVTQFNSLILERCLELESELRAADVVVAHDWLTLLAAELFRKRFGTRLVLTIHDTVIGKTFGKLTNEDKYVAQIERWGCQIADAVVAVSGHIRSELEGVYEAPPGRVHVVPCGVDPDWFGALSGDALQRLRNTLAEPHEKIVTYVGRLDPEKGIDHLVEAFAVLARSLPDLRLVLAGKGRCHDALSEQAKRLEISDRMKFLGYVSGPALEALYKSSTVVVCPSTYEPFGIVPLEGMINRIPVVVSDTGGMAEIVEDGKSGRKVPPGDVPALTEAIGSILTSPDLVERFSRGGYERASRVYSWDRVARLVDPVYSGVRKATMARKRPKLTAGIRVKNGERFAEECLSDLSQYVDEIVILDDGSTDRTEEICRSFSKVTNYVRWEKTFFHEGWDRTIVLALARNTNPDWLLFPDIDEVFENRFQKELQSMMERKDAGLYLFPFYHFWRSRTRYRVDGIWEQETKSHPIPRLVRNNPGLHFPGDQRIHGVNLLGVEGKSIVSEIRVKHYGHLYEDLTLKKHKLYTHVDPEGDYSHMTDESGLQLAEWHETPPSLKEAVANEAGRD